MLPLALPGQWFRVLSEWRERFGGEDRRASLLVLALRTVTLALKGLGWILPWRTTLVLRVRSLRTVFPDQLHPYLASLSLFARSTRCVRVIGLHKSSAPLKGNHQSRKRIKGRTSGKASWNFFCWIFHAWLRAARIRLSWSLVVIEPVVISSLSMKERIPVHLDRGEAQFPISQMILRAQTVDYDWLTSLPHSTRGSTIVVRSRKLGPRGSRCWMCRVAEAETHRSRMEI